MLNCDADKVSQLTPLEQINPLRRGIILIFRKNHGFGHYWFITHLDSRWVLHLARHVYLGCCHPAWGFGCDIGKPSDQCHTDQSDKSPVAKCHRRGHGNN